PRPRLLLCAGVAAEFGAASGSLEEGGGTKPPSAARGTGPAPRNASHLPAPERPAPSPHRHLLNPHGSASAAAHLSARTTTLRQGSAQSVQLGHTRPARQLTIFPTLAPSAHVSCNL